MLEIQLESCNSLFIRLLFFILCKKSSEQDFHKIRNSSDLFVYSIFNVAGGWFHRRINGNSVLRRRSISVLQPNVLFWVFAHFLMSMSIKIEKFVLKREFWIQFCCHIYYKIWSFKYIMSWNILNWHGEDLMDSIRV